MNHVRPRPFYAEYAWAFDLLIDRPVGKECAVIVGWLVASGVLPGVEILDAGCGTGRYSVELARRGYIVHGIDVSPELLEVARLSTEQSSGSVSFAVADLLGLSKVHYAGILCRGVLNDIIDDDRRDAVFGRFARALRPGGVLILDVRAWGASAARKTREPVFCKRVSTSRGVLTFTSVTELDPANQQLLISERHALVNSGVEHVTDYQFVMRCWERQDLERLLNRHGFGHVRYFGAYNPDVEVGTTDRIVALAQRVGTAA
jgi:SAM-dependent methyltransferase